MNKTNCKWLCACFTGWSLTTFIKVRCEVPLFCRCCCWWWWWLLVGWLFCWFCNWLQNCWVSM